MLRKCTINQWTSRWRVYTLWWIHRIRFGEFQNKMEVDSGVCALCRFDVDVPFKEVAVEWLGGNGGEIRTFQLNEIPLQPLKGSFLVI